VDEIVGVLLDYELEQLGSGITTRHCSQLIITINSLLQTMVSSALMYRHTKEDQYQAKEDVSAPMPEYVPWTSVSGEGGLRTVLHRQVKRYDGMTTVLHKSLDKIIATYVTTKLNKSLDKNVATYVSLSTPHLASSSALLL
jgi:hypothetical protein